MRMGEGKGDEKLREGVEKRCVERCVERVCVCAVRVVTPHTTTTTTTGLNSAISCLASKMCCSAIMIGAVSTELFWSLS